MDLVGEGNLDKVNKEVLELKLKSGRQSDCMLGRLEEGQRWSGSRAAVQPRLCSLEQLHPPGEGGAFV